MCPDCHARAKALVMLATTRGVSVAVCRFGSISGPKPDEPEPKGKAFPSAVRANLDDPPIHIRPIVPASAGAKDKNPVGSGHYGTLSIAPRWLNRNGFLCRKCQESGGKGLSVRPETLRVI